MLYRKKSDWILPFTSNRKVLDLGCVQHTLEYANDPEWLHGQIAHQASSLTGVDYLEKESKELQKRGFDIRIMNVETMELNEKFDVIVAGDIIEHLSNIGMFLESTVKHMHSESIFLVSTPNPVNILRFLRVLFSGKVGGNKEHTCWFTDKMLNQLAARYGLEPVEISYVDDSYQWLSRRRKIKWAPWLLLNFLLCRLRPALSETLCMSFRLKSTNG
jgi:2-polyprenyl-3-methyl-5-hydroxy-6-metoxy-1,4-benzoquinol methylase